MVIKFWGADNPNGFLSNFYFSDVTFGDIVYPTVEHYFQSKKFEGTKYEEYILYLDTPKEAAKEGKRRDLPFRKDWEKVKEDIMYEALQAKFYQSYSLSQMLISTGDHELIENSPYDYYWGVGRDKTGKNRLGILLMKLREEIKSIKI
jgi:ribA/ribD-fused uncharacterized protein